MHAKNGQIVYKIAKSTRCAVFLSANRVQVEPALDVTKTLFRAVIGLKKTQQNVLRQISYISKGGLSCYLSTS